MQASQNSYSQNHNNMLPNFENQSAHTNMIYPHDNKPSAGLMQNPLQMLDSMAASHYSNHNTGGGGAPGASG